MKLYKPLVQIARRTNVGAPNNYYLHAVTFCDKSNYRAAGFQLDSSLVPEGLLTVRLNITQDIAFPAFDYLSPVVHTIDLGQLAFPNDEGAITVEAVLNNGERDGDPPAEEEQVKDKSTVSSTEADEAGRPVVS